jgi:hypothetical protein
LAFACSNVIRRHELAGVISPDRVAQVHDDLLDLPGRGPADRPRLNGTPFGFAARGRREYP